MSTLHIGGPLHGQYVETDDVLTYVTDASAEHLNVVDRQYILQDVNGEEIYALATWCHRDIKAALTRLRRTENPNHRSTTSCSPRTRKTMIMPLAEGNQINQLVWDLYHHPRIPAAILGQIPVAMIPQPPHNGWNT